MLTVVGTGIELAGQLTPRARAEIRRADDVPYLVADPATGAWLEELTDRARSLVHLYRPGPRRNESYEAIAEEIVARVRDGLRVCAVFYGHPGLFVDASHRAVRLARAEGFEARMLPAVSAEDCLVADLGVDLGRSGWQGYEATDFLLRPRRVEPTAALLLWQVGGLGELGYPIGEPTRERLQLLVDVLAETYPLDHEVVVYEASPYPVVPPVVRQVPLSELVETRIPGSATLYVPPFGAPERDVTRVRRLGL